MAQMAALERIGKVEDIADIVAFLAGDDARWISGQVIHVNGGYIYFPFLKWKVFFRFRLITLSRWKRDCGELH
ncbi:MAG: SDR family oxidoreductase [Desulfobacterales bacterium]|jgi:hypothetical protein